MSLRISSALIEWLLAIVGNSPGANAEIDFSSLELYTNVDAEKKLARKKELKRKSHREHRGHGDKEI